MNPASNHRVEVTDRKNRVTYEKDCQAHRREEKRCQEPFLLLLLRSVGTLRAWGRPLRAAPGGGIYHVWNRANGRQGIFETAGDYEAFERVLIEGHDRVAMRTLAYCVMPNHWHLVVWPRREGDLSRFMAWLTLTHTQRWHAYHHSTGTGHLYQGRFKSFPVQSDEHFLTVCPLCRTESLTGQPGGSSGRVALVQFVALEPGNPPVPGVVGRLANDPTTQLGSGGQMSRRPPRRSRRCGGVWHGGSPMAPRPGCNE